MLEQCLFLILQGAGLDDAYLTLLGLLGQVSRQVQQQSRTARNLCPFLCASSRRLWIAWSPKLHIRIQRLIYGLWKGADTIYPPRSIAVLLRHMNAEVEDARIPDIGNDLSSSIKHGVFGGKGRHELMEFA